MTKLEVRDRFSGNTFKYVFGQTYIRACVLDPKNTPLNEKLIEATQKLGCLISSFFLWKEFLYAESHVIEIKFD